MFKSIIRATGISGYIAGAFAVANASVKPVPQLINLSDFTVTEQERALFNQIIALVGNNGKIAYHKGCPDAVFAKYLIEKYCDINDDVFMEYAHNTGCDDFKESLIGRDVLFLDVMPNPSDLVKIKETSNSVSVIDHHFKVHKDNVKAGLTNDINDMFYDGVSVALVVARLINVQNSYELQMAQSISDNDTFKEIHESECLFLAINKRLDGVVTTEKFAELIKNTDLQTLYDEGCELMAKLHARAQYEIDERKANGIVVHEIQITGEDGTKPYRVIVTDLTSIKDVNIFVSKAMEQFDVHYVILVQPKIEATKNGLSIITKVRGDAKKYKTYDMNDICSTFKVSGGGHKGAGVMRIQIEQFADPSNVHLKFHEIAKRILETGIVEPSDVEIFINES